LNIDAEDGGGARVVYRVGKAVLRPWQRRRASYRGETFG
jgi:hypothetical protein